MAELTTFDEAQRCPKCEQFGEEVKEEERPGPNGSKLHVIRCMNTFCSWYDTDWIVQVNSDNTVPVREPGPKTFPAVRGMTTAKARDAVRGINDKPSKRR